MSTELPIPDAAASDPKARELARVWAANGAQHVSLRVGLWRDPFSWGIMLADLANHIANAYAQEQSRDRAGTVARILEGMHAELERPTDTPTGRLLPPHHR
jgi:hypothetical protein